MQDARGIAMDYTAVNKVAEEIKAPVKNQQEVIARLARCKVFTDLDARRDCTKFGLLKELNCCWQW